MAEAALHDLQASIGVSDSCQITLTIVAHFRQTVHSQSAEPSRSDMP